MKTWVGSCFEENPKGPEASRNPQMLLGCERNPEIWSIKDTIPSERESGLSTFQTGTTCITIATSLEAMLECYCIVISASKVAHLYNQLLFPLKKT